MEADASSSAQTRPSWDEYFLKLAMLASERATCPRMHCGCVLVKDKNVVATGYNGSIPGDDHCEDVGCLVINNHCERTVHAEMNALVQAAKRGHAVEGTTAYEYVLHQLCESPYCRRCKKNCGIFRFSRHFSSGIFQ